MGATTPSSALLAANKRLLALRQQQGITPSIAQSAPLGVDATATAVTSLPPHLGWHSPAVTSTLRQKESPSVAPTPKLTQPPLSQTPSKPIPPPIITPIAPDQAFFTLDPALGVAFLRYEQSAAARLWFLLRHLDPQGSGRLPLKATKQQVTGKNEPYRLCGQRQWRNLLRAGDHLFWERDEQFIWLRSTVKVTAHLGIEKLTGTPVAIPITALLQGIGTFRAHLYAAFHSGRAPRPIARASLQALTGLSPNSQRQYEAQLNMTVKTNIAIGEAYTAEAAEERHWQQGTACFSFTDHHGHHGQAGQTYLAWQLPNSYHGPHQPQSRGRQKQINRQLQDLVMQGIPGNRTTATSAWAQLPRYVANGRLATRLYGRHESAIYWAEPKQLKQGYWYPLTSC
ncbi:MAG TPA: hypothetical protein VLL52_24580 [Anaerolineae bacterium]|nr:hypothetical protein [Anaerolineae bacterium]